MGGYKYLYPRHLWQSDSVGDPREKALANIRQAVAVYIEDCRAAATHR